MMPWCRHSITFDAQSAAPVQTWHGVSAVLVQMVAGMSAVPVQMWAGGVSAVLVQMWAGWAHFRRSCGRNERSPGADVAA